MTQKPPESLPTNSKLWRTHESVLKANYPVTEKVEKTGRTLVHKFYLGEHEVMERRLIADVAADKNSCDIQAYSSALGSFRGDLRNISFTITREEFEFLKEIWK